MLLCDAVCTTADYQTCWWCSNVLYFTIEYDYQVLIPLTKPNEHTRIIINSQAAPQTAAGKHLIVKKVPSKQTISQTNKQTINRTTALLKNVK
jgi:hypothetical protein